MPYDSEERDSEARKLDALVAIGTGIGNLGATMTALLERDIEQRNFLGRMDRKLDQLIELATKTPA